MYIFLFVFIGLIILALLLQKQETEQSEKMFLSISFAVLMLMRTFVDINSVPDLPLYYDGWKEIGELPFFKVPFSHLITLKCPEVGFRYILWATRCIMNDFRLTLLLISITYLTLLINVIRLYSPNVYLSIIILSITVFPQSIFVLRQHLAISICMFSITYILDRNVKSFVLCILLAFLFHQTAIVFVPIYILYSIRNKKLFVLFLILGAAFVFMMFAVVLTYAADLLIGYSSYIGDMSGNRTSLAIAFLYLFMYCYVLKGRVFEDGVEKIVFCCLVMSFVGQLAGGAFPVVNRLMMYYSSIVFLSVPLIASGLKVSLFRRGFCLVIIGLYVYMFLFGSDRSLEDFTISFNL